MNAINCNAQVLCHETVAEGIRKLVVRYPRADHAPHAGQFFMLRCWKKDEAPFLSRPISVHDYDEQTGTLTFLYQVKGAGTEKLAALPEGGELELTGPMGNGFDTAALASKYEKILVVGGGIGTAPLFQLVKELAAAGRKPDVCFGFTDVPYETGDYKDIANFVKVATDSGKAGVKGFVTGLYDPKEYDLLLLCGPTPMMRGAAKGAAEAGVDCLCSLEAKMACGIGACLGCTCRTTRGEAVTVCKNGPVFDAKEVF